MLLPGGLLRGGELRRQVTLRPLDGELELLIAETRTRAGQFQQAVSQVLAGAIEELDGEAMTPTVAGELCVADRQFLMRQLACALGLGRHWLSVSCTHCSQTFDVEIDLETLPVREAGASFPFATVETAAGQLRLRVPSGADQLAASAQASPEQAERELLRLCLVEPATPPALSSAELTLVEEALEDVSPAVVTRLAATCPECRQVQELRLDPYAAMSTPAERVLDEVHVLASHYHWSERDILGLSRERRQFYLSRVDRARGLSS
jgi:hypothetical protein